MLLSLLYSFLLRQTVIMAVSELNATLAVALIQGGIGLKVMLHKFSEFYNPVTEEPEVVS